MLQDRPDDRLYGGSGGEDVVYNKEGGRGDTIIIGGSGGWRGAGNGGVYIIEPGQFGFALLAGHSFDLPGEPGFMEQGGGVPAFKLGGQGSAQLIERRGAVGDCGCFIMVQRPDDSGIGGD